MLTKSVLIFEGIQKSKKNSFDPFYSLSNEIDRFHSTICGRLSAYIQIRPSLYYFTKLWTSLRVGHRISSYLHRTLVATSICCLVLRPRKYASMVKLTKTDVSNVTRPVSSSHTCSEVSTRLTIKDAYNGARPGQ